MKKMKGFDDAHKVYDRTTGFSNRAHYGDGSVS